MCNQYPEFFPSLHTARCNIWFPTPDTYSSDVRTSSNQPFVLLSKCWVTLITQCGNLGCNPGKPLLVRSIPRRNYAERRTVGGSQFDGNNSHNIASQSSALFVDVTCTFVFRTLCCLFTARSLRADYDFGERATNLDPGPRISARIGAL